MKPVEVQPVFLMYAFRYALGRMTYAVGSVADTLIAYRDELDPQWREQIVEDIERAIAGGHAGMDMDVRQWERVAAAMRGERVRPTPQFTGFWEAQGPEFEAEVRTTLGPVALDDVMGRLYNRLHELPAGVNVRIDLISWGDVGEDASEPVEGREEL